MKLLKRLFCKHDYEFIRNIHGDEIIFMGFKRSKWKCWKCGKIKLGDNYYGPSKPYEDFRIDRH